MIITPVYGWRGPALGDIPDGKKAFQELALDVEGTMASAAATSWTPEFFATGTSIAASNPTGLKQGLYSVRNGWCSVAAHIVVGAGFNAGTGPISFTLPVAAAMAPETQSIQFLMGYVGYANFEGLLQIVPGQNTGMAYVPLAVGDSRTAPLQTADVTNAADTGWPRALNGTKTIQETAPLTFSGRYKV